MLGPIFMRAGNRFPGAATTGPCRLDRLAAILEITTWQATIGFAATPLPVRPRLRVLLFQIVAFVQLLLTLFFATTSAAGAVSQEKDRRTFILLLLTDMRDYEIVLGKMLGALLPITIQLLVSAPVLALLLLLGGIDPEQVLQTILVLGASAVAAGSLGGLIALWRDRTFQALALSVLFLVLYLCVTQGLGAVGAIISPDTDWFRVQAWLDPFISMQTVLGPPAGGWDGIAPAYGFVLVMMGVCALLNGIGIWKLRKWNPSGEPIMQREGPQDAIDTDESVELEKRAKAHAAPGAARQVWHNPVLWREVRTLAYGRRPLLVKVAFGVVFALILYFAISELNRPGGRPAFAAAYGLVPVAVLGLLPSRLRRQRRSRRNAMAGARCASGDRYFPRVRIRKILGVLYNCKEYLLPPLLLAAFMVLERLTRTRRRRVRRGSGGEPGPLVAVVGALLVLFAFVIVLGIHVSLRIPSSRVAIAQTLGTVFFLSIGTLICIYLIIINGGSFANQWVSFIAFLVVGIGGLWYVLTADRPSIAINLASVACPLAMFYCVVTVLIGKPGTEESADPLLPFLFLAVSFGVAIGAMLVPLLAEFDVALGRTEAPNET